MPDKLPPKRPLVVSRHGRFRFQSGMVTSTLLDLGLSMDAAYELSRELKRRVTTGRKEITTDELEAELEALLASHGFEGTTPTNTAQSRYALVEWLKREDTPVVLFLGGATGTGKSTLAMELAFLLGIRMVVSTDMIRETMRTVLPAEVVPGLHDHSFRGMLQGGQVLSDPRERVLVGFRQQASQVAVGVRAVIRRALREHTHMIVEGTHLMPPFSRYLPSEAPPHAGMILAVPSEAQHRARFPQRAQRAAKRDASTYLDAFQSVRWIHDDLLASAEDNEVLVMPTGKVHSVAMSAFDYFSAVLPNTMPTEPAPRPRHSQVPTLFMIVDGLPDEPCDSLSGLTPLQAADTPFLEMLAHVGGQGQMMTAPEEGAVAHTDEGIFSLLGTNPPKERLGRGIFEALGQDVPLSPGSVVLRGNLATRRPGGSLVDRRAGRISSGQQDLLAGLRNVPLTGGIVGSVFPGLEHRVVVMLRGPGLSHKVSDTDPGGEAALQQVLQARPLDEAPESARTAAALREFLDKVSKHLTGHPLNADRVAQGLLPANCILTRGAASTQNLPERQHDSKEAAMVAACPTALGVGRLIGMQTTTSLAMTGSLDTDLDAKFDMAAEMLETHSLVVMHFKGTDVAAHECRPLAKRDYISRMDVALGRFLQTYGQVTPGLRIVVSADHATSSVTGNHMADPVPVLVANWRGPGEQAEFNEASAEHGALGILGPGELAEMLWPS